jgi:hypothetical protein
MGKTIYDYSRVGYLRIRKNGKSAIISKKDASIVMRFIGNQKVKNRRLISRLEKIRSF